MGEAPAGFHHRALELSEHWPLVYTALSKHSFCYRVLISRFVLERGAVPINPAMNFDFGLHGLVPKDVVLTANNNALRASSALWMFGPISDGAFAEIVLAERLGLEIRYFEIRGDWSIREISERARRFEDDVVPLAA